VLTEIIAANNAIRVQTLDDSATAAGRRLANRPAHLEFQHFAIREKDV
jgi:hypothetical protein